MVNMEKNKGLLIRNSEGNMNHSQVGNQLVYKDVNKKYAEEPVNNTLMVTYNIWETFWTPFIRWFRSLFLRYPVEFIEEKQRF